MHRARRRPSAALVVAFLALLVALGGTAGADPVAYVAKVIKGKSIKKGSLPADRLRANSLTGKQIAESKLGTVPSAQTAASARTAAKADTATTAETAGSATTAGSAATATTAASAATAGRADTAGKADTAAALQGRITFGLVRATPTFGTNQEDARLKAPSIPLGELGPFSFTGKCFATTGGVLTSAVYVATSAPAAIFDSGSSTLDVTPFTPATPEPERRVASVSVNADPALDAGTPSFTAVTGDAAVHGAATVGARYAGNGADAAWGTGDVCLLSGWAEVG